MALLRDVGVAFRQIVPSLEEPRDPDAPAFLFAQHLAEHKALWVAKQVDAGHLVIGCDTIVVLDDKILQKPDNEEEAFEILSALSGQMHVVCTALALVRHEELLASGYELTEVFFNPVTAEQIRDYIATGEPMDKAGA